MCKLTGFDIEENRVNCTKCPLYKAGNGCCERGSAYRSFMENPCLETVQNMVLVLQSLLVKYLTEEEIKKPKEIKLKSGQIWVDKNNDYIKLVSLNDADTEWCKDFLNKGYNNGFSKAYSTKQTIVFLEEYSYTLCSNARIEVINDRK